MEEKLLTLNDLIDADRIYACNALRGLYELDFQRKGFLMKLIFLHGLGQDVLSWQGVQFGTFTLCTPKLFDIFSHPKESYQEVKERLMERLQQESEPFILVGLSLGGVLALDLSRQDFPQLKGLVLAGTQYKLNTNPLYRLQILLFRLLPKHVFEKQDANKQQMLQILTELKGSI